MFLAQLKLLLLWAAVQVFGLPKITIGGAEGIMEQVCSLELHLGFP
jgi:hypothetical protein